MNGFQSIRPEDVPGVMEALKPFLLTVSEVQMLDCSIRSGYGAWVKFRFPEPGIVEPYRGMTGKRFHLLVIAIDDHDVPQEARNMTKENKPYKLSQLAGMMCNDAQFREFIKDHYLADGTDKDTAAVFVREYCGVESRSLLDSNDTAGAIFKDMLNVFDAWKQARGNEG